jgi:hypothetical protein
MQHITEWINKTNDEISQRNSDGREFDKFIQVYFLLNNLLNSSNNDSKIIENASDTSLITEYLPKFVEKNWETISEDPVSRQAAEEVFLIMQYHLDLMLKDGYFADTGISSRKHTILVKTREVGYFNSTSGFINVTMTEADYSSFLKISEFNDFKKGKLKGLLEGSLEIIYAIRNNFYHGGKSKKPSQDQLIQLIILAIIKLLKILYSLENQLFSEKWSFWNEISLIEDKYDLVLKDRIRTNLMIVYDEEKNDYANWLKLADNNKLHLNFSYYFITLERLKSLIEKTTYQKHRNVVEALAFLNNYFSLNSEEIDQAKDDLSECKLLRNNIFHGDSNIDLGQDLAGANSKLSEIVKLVHDVIKQIISQ